MTEEFYDSAYLQKTGLLAQSMKEASYESFKYLRDSTIVDLGCGAGEDIYQLSKLLDGSNNIIGVDHNAILLNEAKNKNSARTNCQFIKTEAHELPFTDHSVHALRTERMFQHLKAPYKTMVEIRRVLSDGGKICLLESDWNGLTFYNENSEVEEKIRRYLTQKKVNNGYASRTLLQTLIDCHFTIEQTQIFTTSFHNLEEANEALQINTILKECYENGFFSSKEYLDCTHSFNELNEKKAFVCSINSILINASKR
jgi:ubiquinone/menaquinone biosynthesis C-methylase UbiE